MSFLERIADGLGKRSIDSATPDFFNVLRDEQLDGGFVTSTGKRISPEGAVEGIVAVYACVSLLAEVQGALPRHLYRRISERERERVSETSARYPGSLARMLHQTPNPEMTAQEFWELSTTHRKLWGNFYAEIERDGSGRPRNLWPLRPDLMTVTGNRRVGRIYTYQLPSGEPVIIPRRNVLHVKAFGHGIVGIPPIGVARQSLGLSVSAEEYAGRFFANSAVPGGILTTEEKPPGDPARQREWVKSIRKAWQDTVGGLRNAHRMAVLHSGLDYKAVGVPPKDAQFVETRRFQKADIATMFRIPGHLVGSVGTSEGGATVWGTGIEQLGIGFVVYTIAPDIIKEEQAVNRDLRDPESNRTLLDENLFMKVEVAGLLRGDMAARAQFYQSGIDGGWMLRADARDLEDLPPVDGLDKPILKSGFQVLDDDGMPPEPPAPPPPEDDDETGSPIDRAYRAHLKALNGSRLT